MSGRGHPRVARVAMLAMTCVAVACGGREIDLPDAADVPEPAFVARPDDLSDSFQLAAMPIRDTAGLPPAVQSALADQLPAALDALLSAVDPRPVSLSRLSVYGDSIHFTFPDPAIGGRSIGAFWRPADGLRLSEPRFDDSEMYAVDHVDPSVPARLVAAIESRFPSVHVSSLDLDRGLSHDFDLVWYVLVEDARGRLATVYADTDGSVLAVDEW